jgi:hypothetical protein
MAASFNYTADQRIPLSEIEYARLAEMLEKGDRAGFYMAYYAMTGNTEALLTAKISTFSERSGGIAFAANWLLQDQYRSAAPEQGGQPYQGIYYLSQQVAESILASIRQDLDNEDVRQPAADRLKVLCGWGAIRDRRLYADVATIPVTRRAFV